MIVENPTGANVIEAVTAGGQLDTLAQMMMMLRTTADTRTKDRARIHTTPRKKMTAVRVRDVLELTKNIVKTTGIVLRNRAKILAGGILHPQMTSRIGATEHQRRTVIKSVQTAILTAASRAAGGIVMIQKATLETTATNTPMGVLQATLSRRAMAMSHPPLQLPLAHTRRSDPETLATEETILAMGRLVPSQLRLGHQRLREHRPTVNPEVLNMQKSTSINTPSLTPMSATSTRTAPVSLNTVNGGRSTRDHDLRILTGGRRRNTLMTVMRHASRVRGSITTMTMTKTAEEAASTGTISMVLPQMT